MAPVNNLYLKSMHRFVRRGEHPASFGRSVFISPHQDDEVLGCGGTISLCKAGKRHTAVVYMGNGRSSHRSPHMSPAELGRLRDAEATEAMGILGVPEENLHFLALEETVFPRPNGPDGQEVVERLGDIFEWHRPNAVYVPYRFDPNNDHMATFELVAAAASKTKVRLIEYPVWFWERSWFWQMPVGWVHKRFRVDIASQLSLKKAALAAYRTQTTHMFGDPSWRTLSGEFLANFFQEHEIFFEIGDGGGTGWQM